jgi:hypothetical protein
MFTDNLVFTHLILWLFYRLAAKIIKNVENDGFIKSGLECPMLGEHRQWRENANP